MNMSNSYLIFFILFGFILLFDIGFCEIKCPKNTKECTCSGLHYIPVVPDKTTALNLSYNCFPYLMKNMFVNVSSIRLRRLVLEHNYIERIDPDVFSDLNFLKTLTIRDEDRINITDLKQSFQSLNFETIEKLSLENNEWGRLTQDLFYYLKRAKNLSNISLRGNKLQKLHSNLFLPISGLKYLSCAGNSIAYVNASDFRSVEHLDLTDNNIYLVPNFCDNTTGKTVVPRLKTLFLSFNAIRDLNIESFKCLETLQKLLLDGNRMRSLENNIFASLNRLEELSVGYLSQLRIISDHAFNSSSLHTLKFYFNNYRFDRSKQYNLTIFHFLPNLRVLDLTKNYLPKKEVNILKLLENLPHLIKIRLDTTFLNTIPNRLLQKMPKLQELILIGNKISRLDASLFVNMTSLKRLNIAGNQLHLVNRTSFPHKLLDRLETLDLSANPFWCTCDQMWFINLLRTTNITMKMLAWPKYYTCDYPQNFQFEQLSKYNPNDDECRPFKIISIVIIIVSSTSMFVFFGVIVLLRCQVNIRNALYFVRVFRRIKQGYIKLESSEDFEFDAFVVYCDADRQWVHGILLNKLETAGLKICVHHRDFDVGEPITNNIEKYMNKSWKVIVVMSNNFAKSEWCQWELDLVQERRRQKGKEAIVLIMYSEIDYKHMTSPLRTLLHTTPHLIFKEGFGEQLFWKTVTQDINKSLRYPPAALA